MDLETFLLETEEAMEKAADFVATEMTSIRTGKASPALLDNIHVHVHSYGTTMSLKQIALVSAPEPRMLTVQPHDPSIMQDIDRALRESKLGINPSNDGRLIRLPIPELSEERPQGQHHHRGSIPRSRKGSPDPHRQIRQIHRRAPRREGEGCDDGVSHG